MIQYSKHNNISYIYTLMTTMLYHTPYNSIDLTSDVSNLISTFTNISYINTLMTTMLHHTPYNSIDLTSDVSNLTSTFTNIFNIFNIELSIGRSISNPPLYTLNSVSSDFYYNKFVHNYYSNVTYTHYNSPLVTYNNHVFVPRLNNIGLYNYVYVFINMLKLFAENSMNVFLFYINELISLIAFLHGFVSNVFCLQLISFLLSVLSLILSTSKPLVFALSLFSLIQLTSSANTSMITLYNKEVIVTTLGGFTHYFVGVFYDYTMYKQIHLNTYVWSVKWTKFILGITYAFYIFAGVFFTNGIWYFIADGAPRPLTFIFSTLFTVIFGTLWHVLGSTRGHNKIRISFRSAFETLAFTCVATSTYCFWFWLPSQALHYNIIYAITGLLLHLPFSAYAITLEYVEDYTILYGVCYFLSFLGGSLSTNGLFTIYTSMVTSQWVHIMVSTITFGITAYFYPNFYKSIDASAIRNRKSKLNKMDVFISTTTYYLIFVSFVTYTGLFNIWFVG